MRRRFFARKRELQPFAPSDRFRARPLSSDGDRRHREATSVVCARAHAETDAGLD